MAVPDAVSADQAESRPVKRPRRDEDEPAATPTPDTPVVTGGTTGKEGTTATGKGPPRFADGGYVDAGGGWWGHSGGEWLYNTEEKTYFHLPTGQLQLAVDESTVVPFSAPGTSDALIGEVTSFNPRKGFGFLAPLSGDADSQEVFFHKKQLAEDFDLRSLKPGVRVSYALGKTDDGRVCAEQVKKLETDPEGNEEEPVATSETEKIGEQQDDAPADGEGAASGEEGEEGDEDGAGSESSVDIDLFEELKSGVYQVKGDAKDQCEDFAVDKVKIPVSVLGETATCVFFGVFDGHGGAYCAEYASTHLAKNVLARLRDRTKNANDETALKTALMGGFKQTEHNFLQHAKRAGDGSGSTACTMTVFGPDEEMRLRLFMAHCGDSRAVLGKANGGHLRLTEDHKPNLPNEKKRVELEGGSVVQVAGVWRAILPVKRRLGGIAGLAVSRSFGDKDFKNPNIVSADPDITVHEVDWDEDEFVILATDGIWDVVSDKEAVRLVQQSLRQFGNEEKAAEELVRKATGRGSRDDCTVLVVRFGWLKTGELPDAAGQSASDAEDMETQELPAEQQEDEAAAAEAMQDMEEESEEEEEGEEEMVEQPGEQPGRAALEADGDDIFAMRPEDEEDKGEQAGQEGPSPLLTDISDLFAGLGPTREEQAVVEGPALPRQSA